MRNPQNPTKKMRRFFIRRPLQCLILNKLMTWMTYREQLFPWVTVSIMGGAIRANVELRKNELKLSKNIQYFKIVTSTRRRPEIWRDPAWGRPRPVRRWWGRERPGGRTRPAPAAPASPASPLSGWGDWRAHRTGARRRRRWRGTSWSWRELPG